MQKLAINVKELAQLLGIGVNAAYDLIHVQGFPVIKTGKRYIIPLSALNKWLDEAGGEFN